ncbi:hydroxymethylglutaryl-CoA reductase, degradative [Pseudomonas putida]|uniref:hydroxymethylglutaryl-CoA reductase, degradative n=1 Tax=Pseudomonas putida TaxID=303 RepID=UPI002DBD1B48|nr:hydroxymethylglutaryl-CoA reductase, degradative [Pseudomonas putida]WRW04780.1 hydroxymethylglutaryl-CoA reductase, degradative [Pseudomonas putida]
MTVKERQDYVARTVGLSAAQAEQLARPSNLDSELANHMIENMISTISIPVGIATGVRVDGRDLLVPMATEEHWIIKAVCSAAELCQQNGGFRTSSSGSLMIAQIQLVDVPAPYNARLAILENRDEIASICNGADPTLVSFGGGFHDLEVRVLESTGAPMVITHLIIDTRDAMGANTVNTMAERVAPLIAQVTGGRPLLRILSNLADRRLVRARAVWPLEAIGGESVRDAIIDAYRFAEADPYRAVTNNKGTMNGISAVVLATGNDTRAVEAGAHSYAARHGQIRSLTKWEVSSDGGLAGSIELPMAVGTVGGAVKIHPTAQALLAILAPDSAETLGRIIAAVGLAENFSAMKALATVGIQNDFMALHAQTIAVSVGAVGPEVAQLTQALVNSGKINAAHASVLLDELRN